MKGTYLFRFVYLRLLNPPLDDAEDDAEDATAAVVDSSTGGGAGVLK